MRVLIVEDAPEYAALVSNALRADGHTVVVSSNGADGLVDARVMLPEVVILDVMLPGLNGFDVCRELRLFSDAHIIMLSGKGDEVDRIVGLTVGADDYVTKPFSIRELQARVAAAGRRRSQVSPEPDMPSCRIGDLSIDAERRVVTVAGVPMELTRTEFDLLAALSSNQQSVWTREALVEAVWPERGAPHPSVVDSHIKNLRRKLDHAGVSNLIASVRGIGFRLSVKPVVSGSAR